MIKCGFVIDKAILKEMVRSNWHQTGPQEATGAVRRSLRSKASATGPDRDQPGAENSKNITKKTKKVVSDVKIEKRRKLV